MLFDIALGIVLTGSVATMFGVTPSDLHYLLGIIFALAPDLDFLVLYFRKHEIAMYRGHTIDHRDLLHKPLLFIPVGSILIFLVFGSVWLVTLFIVASLLHFIHDSIGIGWGVRWLSPFDMRNFKFFSDNDGRPSCKLVTTWTPSQRAVVVSQKGDPNWVWDYFLSPFAEMRMTYFAFIEVVLPILVIVLFTLDRYF